MQMTSFAICLCTFNADTLNSESHTKHFCHFLCTFKSNTFNSAHTKQKERNSSSDSFCCLAIFTFIQQWTNGGGGEVRHSWHVSVTRDCCAVGVSLNTRHHDATTKTRVTPTPYRNANQICKIFVRTSRWRDKRTVVVFFLPFISFL